MKVAPPAGWRCCSRLALTVWSCSEDTVLICWQKCRSVLLDPAGWLSHQGMAPTAPLPPLPAHTGLHSSCPLCLPSHVEGPTSVTTPTRWTSESSDWRGQREALGGVETEEMGACSQWEQCSTLLKLPAGGFKFWTPRSNTLSNMLSPFKCLLLVHPRSVGSLGRRLKPWTQVHVSEPPSCVLVLAGHSRHPPLSLAGL